MPNTLGKDSCFSFSLVARFCFWLNFILFWLQKFGIPFGCGKFSWHDPEWTEFQEQVVLQLRNAVFREMDENSTLQEEISALRQKLDQVLRQGVHREGADEAAGKPAHEAKIQDSGHNLLMIWVFSVLFAMCVGMMMSSS